MLHKEFVGTIDDFNSDLWGHHVMVPLEISTFFIEHNIKRLQCTLNDMETFQCALMPKGEGRYFINLNKERRKKLKLELGQKIKVKLERDHSEYGLPMPEELKELMNIDAEGHKLFHALTAGKQRNLLFIIGKPKKTETRLHKAWVVLEYLKSTDGNLDFRDLNQAFREHRDFGL